MRVMYLYRGKTSGINSAVFRAFRVNCPQVDICGFDVDDMAWKGVGARVVAAPHAVRRGGLGVLLRRDGSFRDAAKGTRWYMQRLSRMVTSLEDRGPWSFSLTIGTIVPVTEPKQPHFVYTDHAILANRCYPDGEKLIEFWRECLPYERRTLESARLVFTMSRHVADAMVREYGLAAEKVRCVLAGGNAPPVAGAADRHSRRNVVFVGIDWPRKGGPELVQAFSRVRSRVPNATLTVVGCRPAVSQAGVEVVGPVPQEAVSEYLSRASVFCMPSRREPFGIAYIEAMQAGLPVVALDLGAARDFVIDGQTGYRVGLGDVEALADRLAQLLADPSACERMGQRAKQLAGSQYTWSAAQQRIWEAIREVV